MVTQITCYEDSSGKLHKSAFDAHRAELAIWLAAQGEINEASAKALAERMVGSIIEVQNMLSAIEGGMARLPEAA